MHIYNSLKFPWLLGNIQIPPTNVSLQNIHEVSCSSLSPKSLLAGIHQANADCPRLGVNKDVPLNKCRVAFSALETLGIEKTQTSPSAREFLMDVGFLCA